MLERRIHALDGENASQHVTCIVVTAHGTSVVVTALCDQPKAFASDLGGDQSRYLLNKIQFQSNKVCYEVSLCENFQQQSCSMTIPPSNRP